MPARSVGSKASGGGLARGSGAELLLPAGQQSSHELGLDGGLDGRQHAGQAAELAIELLAAAKPPPLDADAAAAQAVGGLLVQRLQSKLSQAGSVAASAAEVGRVQGCVCLGAWGIACCMLHACRQAIAPSLAQSIPCLPTSLVPTQADLSSSGRARGAVATAGDHIR